MQLKKFKATSYDITGNEVETLRTSHYSAKDARKFFNRKIAERSWNEVRIGRVTLDL